MVLLGHLFSSLLTKLVSFFAFEAQLWKSALSSANGEPGPKASNQAKKALSGSCLLSPSGCKVQAD